MGGVLMKPLKVYVIDRSTRVLKDSFDCFTYNINNDYLENSESTFTSKSAININSNDVIVADFKSKNNNEVIENIGLVSRPLFVGIVSSMESDTISANMFFNFTNSEITVSSQVLQKAYIDKYIIDMLADNSKLLDFVNYEREKRDNLIYNTSYLYYENLTNITLKDYLIEAFKRTNMSVIVDYVRINEQNLFELNLICRGFQENAFQIKNNNSDFVNWEYYKEADKNDNFNCLKITHIASADLLPDVLATFYVDKDNYLVQDSLVNVSLPTRSKIFLYDTSAEDNPSFYEIAQSELTPINYNHEISFDLKENSNILNFKDLNIGDSGVIIYDGEVIKSVYTGFIIDSGNNFVTLKFGQHRSTFTSAFQVKLRSAVGKSAGLIT